MTLDDTLLNEDIFFNIHSYSDLKSKDFINIDLKFERILSVFDKNPHDLIFCWLDKDELNEYKTEQGIDKYNYIQSRIYEAYINCIYFYCSRLVESKTFTEFDKQFYGFVMWVNKYLKTYRKLFYEFETTDISFLNDFVKYLDITTDGIDRYIKKSPAFPICPDCYYSSQVRNNEGKLIECPLCEGTGWM